MPVTKEFTVLLEETPNALGEFCRALAERQVNILALQCFPVRNKFVTRLIVDNPENTKAVLNREQLPYTETKIVQAKIAHRPGEIARLASRLGKANININYAYCGLEPGTNAPLVFFSVAEVDEAESLLRKAAVAAAETCTLGRN